MGTEQRWKTDAGNAVSYYRRRTGPAGEPVVVELHFGMGEGHVAAGVHFYAAPDGHATADLGGCQVRASVPARDLYDQWVTAGRSDDVAYRILDEVDVPAASVGTPPHAQAIIDDLRGQLEQARAQLAHGVQPVTLHRHRG